MFAFLCYIACAASLRMRKYCQTSKIEVFVTLTRKPQHPMKSPVKHSFVSTFKVIVLISIGGGIAAIIFQGLQPPPLRAWMRGAVSSLAAVAPIAQPRIGVVTYNPATCKKLATHNSEKTVRTPAPELLCFKQSGRAYMALGQCAQRLEYIE